MHRHILASAERAADGGIDDTHLIVRQIQRVRDLLLVFVRPLTGHLHRHAAFFVHVRQARLGLQESVLLERRVIRSFHNHVGALERFRHIAFADAVMDQHIVLFVSVQLRHAGFHRRARIRDDRQIFVLDLDQVERAGGLLFRLGHHQRDFFADPANDIADKHRRIERDQPKLVDRHILSREHRHDSGRGLRLAHIQPLDARVRPPREQDLHVQHPRHRQVAGVERLAGDFGQRIHAGKRLTDCARRHVHFLLMNPSSSISS